MFLIPKHGEASEDFKNKIWNSSVKTCDSSSSEEDEFTLQDKCHNLDLQLVMAKCITDHIRGYPIEDTSKWPFFDIDSYYSSDSSKQLDSDNVMDYEVNINSDYSSSNDDSKLNPSIHPVKIFENRSDSAVVISPKISTTQHGVYSSDISAKIEENGEVPNDQADGSSGSVAIMSEVCDSEVKPKGKTVSVVLSDKDDNVEA